MRCGFGRGNIVRCGAVRCGAVLHRTAPQEKNALFTRVYLQYAYVYCFGKKILKTEKKYAQGAVLIAGASRIWKFVLKKNVVTDVRFFTISTTSFELRAGDRSVLCHIAL